MARYKKLQNLTVDKRGYWRFVRPYGADGKRVRKSLGKISEAEAVALRDALLNGAGGAVVLPESKISFADVAKLYLDEQDALIAVDSKKRLAGCGSK